MNASEALIFVKAHGVVLGSGKGPVPRLTEAIVGETRKPKGLSTFAVWVAHADLAEVAIFAEARVRRAAAVTTRLISLACVCEPLPHFIG